MNQRMEFFYEQSGTGGASGGGISTLSAAPFSLQEKLKLHTAKIRM